MSLTANINIADNLFDGIDKEVCKIGVFEEGELVGKSVLKEWGWCCRCDVNYLTHNPNLPCPPEFRADCNLCNCNELCHECKA